MPTLTRRHNTVISASSRSSHRSDRSYDSQSTAPTSVTGSPRPSLQHAYTAGSRYSYDADLSPAALFKPRSSAETYASTIASAEELFDEPEEYDDLEYDLPEYDCTEAAVEAETETATEIRASTPQDFSDYFPSQRRLFIRHDETTSDGNMNLRVDAEVVQGRNKTQVQLFHLRMHDLKAREFSLRRYCRDSGGEVCHSSRRYVTPSQRPALQRSMSNALNSFRSRPEFKRTGSGNSARANPKRQDSGYGSNEEEDPIDADEVDSFMAGSKSRPQLQIPTNTTKLEFSNYAQVDVKRRGAKGSKRYECEYWGSTYQWKRVAEKDGATRAISYHLVKDDSSRPIAHIVPELQSPSQIAAEERAGGWVPPCSFWISDPSVLTALTDVAE
jgi:hypothetical protein